MKTLQSFRLDNDLLDQLKQMAQKENRSLTNYCETILKAYVNGESFHVEPDNKESNELGIILKENSIYESWLDLQEIKNKYKLKLSRERIKANLKSAGIPTYKHLERGVLFDLTNVDIKKILQ